MSERRYKVGLDRQQAMLLPASIDDYVSPANLARAIEAYVDSLDLKKQGMTNTEADSGKGGQPAYPPGMLLKLYLYGYLNRIRANFRKENVKALKGVNRDFVCLCRELDL